MDYIFYVIIDLLVIVCGIYIIVQYIMMTRSGTIRQNMLMPRDLQIKKCKDVDGFIQAVAGKQLILGISALICGAVGVIEDSRTSPNVVISFIIMVVFVVLCFWYGFASKKAIEEFW